MKVAVLGAGGFVGQRMTEWAHLGDHAEVLPVLHSHGSAGRIARLGLPYAVADTLDEAALALAFAGCEVVFHAVTGSAATIEDGPARVAAAARTAGVRRIVYLSSGMVYGLAPLPTDDDETPARVDQARGYNRSKAIAEQRIHHLRRTTGSDIVILRPTIVFGPRSESFTARIAADLLSDRAFLVDDGAGVCNSVYVDNLVSAMWQAAVTPAAANQTFIVSDRERVTWADLYRSVADAIGVDFASIPRIASQDFPTDYGQERPDRLRDLLGSPRVTPLKAAVPPRVKGALKTAARAWSTYQPPSYAQLTARPWPDARTFALQRCQVQLPIAKAERLLAYTPLPFDEAARRTASWLRHMGFAHPIGR